MRTAIYLCTCLTRGMGIPFPLPAPLPPPLVGAATPTVSPLSPPGLRSSVWKHSPVNLFRVIATSADLTRSDGVAELVILLKAPRSRN